MGQIKIMKLLSRAAALIVVALLFGPVPPHSGALAGPTGWCSDYEGNNFRCSDAAGGSYDDADYGYGGGGCATSGGYASVQSPVNPAYEESNNLNSAGLAAKRSGDYNEAISLYRQALAYNSNNMTIYRNLGMALNWQAIEYYDTGNYEKAIQTFDEAVNYVPFDEDLPEILVSLKEEYGNSSDSGEAPRACGICGKALIGDVDYGYGSSSSFRTYVMQSQGKFQNCQNKFYDAVCDDIVGGIFYRNLDSCDQGQANDSSFKLCVDKLLDGHYFQN